MQLPQAAQPVVAVRGFWGRRGAWATHRVGDASRRPYMAM